MSDMMTFPETWEEFEKFYGFNDSEEIYTNNSRLIPSFRVKQWLEHLPSAEPEIIRCKDCKHRDEIECPMRYEEWVSFEEDGYIESDNIAHDQTRDDGFCDRGEREEQE